MRWRSPAWANRVSRRDRRDNNSSDATPDVVASFGPAVRYIKERRQGVSFARNTGIEAARALDAELVAFVDDDVEATPTGPSRWCALSTSTHGAHRRTRVAVECRRATGDTRALGSLWPCRTTALSRWSSMRPVRAA